MADEDINILGRIIIDDADGNAKLSGIANMSGTVGTAFSKLGAVGDFVFGNLIATAIQKVVEGAIRMGSVIGEQLIKFGSEAVMTAARVDELRIVNDVLGEKAGYTAGELDKLESGMRKQGITAEAATDAMAKMMQANLDLAGATDLATVAQNAAVLSGQNSSDTFQQIIYGVTTLNPLILRGQGLIVDSKVAYDKYAATLGKTAAELTGTEKQQAYLNAAIEAGAGIAGAYEKSLENPLKQMKSMERLANDVSLGIGEAMFPAMQGIVQPIYEFMKAMSGAVQTGGFLVPTLEKLKEVSEVVGKKFSEIWTAFKEDPRVQRFIQSVIDSITKLIENIGTFVGNLSASGIVDSVMNFLAPFQMMMDAFNGSGSSTSTLTGALGGVGSAFETIKKMLEPVVESFQKLVAAFQGDAPQINEAVGTVKKSFMDSFGPTLQNVIDNVVKILDNLTKFWKENGDQIIKTLTFIIQLLIGTFAGTIKFIMDLVRGLIQFFTDFAKIFQKLHEGDITGAWEAIKKTIGDAVGNIGKMITDFVDSIATALGLPTIGESWGKVWEQVKEIFGKMWKNITTAVSDGWNALTSYLGEVFANLGRVWGDNWNQYWEIVTKFWSNVYTTVVDFFVTIYLYFMTKLEQIRALWDAVWMVIHIIFMTIVLKIKTAVTDMFDLIRNTVVTKMEEVKTFWTTKWNDVVNFFDTVYKNVETKILLLWQNIKNWFAIKFEEIRVFWEDKWNAIVTYFDTIIKNIKGYVGNFMKVGTDLVAGLWDGIKARWDALVTDWTTIMQVLLDKINAFFDNKSPSKKMAEVGKNIVAGLGKGITDNLDLIPTNFSVAMGLVSSGAGFGGFGGGGSSSSNVNNMTFNINGGDPKAVANEIATQLRINGIQGII